MFCATTSSRRKSNAYSLELATKTTTSAPDRELSDAIDEWYHAKKTWSEADFKRTLMRLQREDALSPRDVAPSEDELKDARPTEEDATTVLASSVRRHHPSTSTRERLFDSAIRVREFFVPLARFRPNSRSEGGAIATALRRKGANEAPIEIRSVAIGSDAEPRWRVVKSASAIGGVRRETKTSEESRSLDPTAFRAVAFGRDLPRPLVSVRHVVEIGADGLEVSVLERCGVPLSRLVDAVGRKTAPRLGPKIIMHVVAQMTWCVAAHHTLGRAHGNVSPESFFLTPTAEGGVEVTLGDFEWACSATLGPLFAHDRRLGYPSGCVPPEFAFDGGCGLYECMQGDVWACGAAALQLALGRKPTWCEPLARVADERTTASENEKKIAVTRRLAEIVVVHALSMDEPGTYGRKEMSRDTWPESDLPPHGSVRWSDALAEIFRMLNDENVSTTADDFETYYVDGLTEDEDKVFARKVLFPRLMSMTNPVPSFRPTARELAFADDEYDDAASSIATRKSLPAGFFADLEGRVPQSTIAASDRRASVRAIASRTIFSPPTSSFGEGQEEDPSRLGRAGVNLSAAKIDHRGERPALASDVVVALSEIAKKAIVGEASSADAALVLSSTGGADTPEADWINATRPIKLAERIMRNAVSLARANLANLADPDLLRCAYALYRMHPDTVPTSGQKTASKWRPIECKTIYEAGYDRVALDELEDPSPADLGIVAIDEPGWSSIANSIGPGSPSLPVLMSMLVTLAYSDSIRLTLSEVEDDRARCDGTRLEVCARELLARAIGKIASFAKADAPLRGALMRALAVAVRNGD